jgi:hypothetical protein
MIIVCHLKLCALIQFITVIQCFHAKAFNIITMLSCFVYYCHHALSLSLDSSSLFDHWCGDGVNISGGGRAFLSSFPLKICVLRDDFFVIGDRAFPGLAFSGACGPVKAATSSVEQVTPSC